MSLYGALALLYSLTVPTWEAPDEVGHYLFVKFLREEKTLPDLRALPPAEYHQPPLYYTLAILPTLFVNSSSPMGAFQPNPNFVWRGTGGSDLNVNLRGTAHSFPHLGEARFVQLARLTSVALGGVTVFMVLQIGRRLFPKRPFLPIFATLLVVLTPQFLFSSGVLNNDNLLIATVTGACWQTLRALDKPRSVRQWGLVGVWLGAALLTKLTGVGVVAAVALAWLFGTPRTLSLSQRVRTGIALAVPVIVIAAWWYVRNLLLYGDPLAINLFAAQFESNMRQNPLNWFEIRQLFKTQFRSFFAVFGWMTVPAPPWYFRLLQLFGLLALAGYGLRGRAFWRTLQQRQQIGLLFLLGVILFQEAVIFVMITRCSGTCYQGRFLLPVIGPVMLFAAIGGFLLVGRKWRGRAAVAVVGLFLALALYMPLVVIHPAYPMSPLEGWRPFLAQQRDPVSFQSTVVLRGYTFEKAEDGVWLDVYWQAAAQPNFDYSAFVHLVQDGQVMSQADLGLGQTSGYLPTAWRAGDMVRDRYWLQYPSETGGEYEIRVGVYNWLTGERLPITNDGSSGDFVTLKHISGR